MSADEKKEEEPSTDAKAIVVSGWGMHSLSCDRCSS